MAPFLLYALLATLSAAQSDNNGMSSSSRIQIPPLDVSEDKWPLLLTDPTKEGVYRFDGFDISKKYPSQPLGGWTVSVSLKADVETQDVVPNATGRYFNAAALRLNPPEDMVGDALRSGNKTFDAHPSWKVMAHRVSLSVSSDRSALAADDGSCTSLMSEFCVRAWQSAAGNNFNVTRGPFQGVPDECRRQYSAAGNTVARSYENWSDTIEDDAAKDIDWYKGSEIDAVGSRPSSEGDEVLLERTETFWDMVLIVWGYDMSVLPEGERVTPMAKVVCTRALLKNGESKNSTRDGEKDKPEAEKDKNDARRSSVSFLGLVLTALVAVLVF